MPYTMEDVRNLDDEMLAAEIDDVELGKTADVRTLFGLKLEIEELAERRQELTAALQALTTERNRRS